MLTGNSETLFIPLAGKARVSRYGDILTDEKAREIMSKVGYDFSKNGQDRFLDIYMGIRAALLDRCAENFLKKYPNGAVLHLGCGLDARVLRVQHLTARWVDLDLPAVMDVRRQFYSETPGYQMVAADVTDLRWLDELEIPADTPVLAVAEGLTMYLTEEQNLALFREFSRKFRYTEYVFDA